ncbi:Mitochondrial distribution and morphology protein 31 [Wickerhamomyces ciferrii]|uniref:Mitochondrial distribution and morphology protein 31 n=1 Tax=Wickerhamomyces ciferrii (strain ATCC 14091 / BCRC 22168 / CBS 111 / JCM 3599 / NBRC 0793 / NRRL Y-1031 F-60-10) TaxID=1206466 RepID=K0KGB5_WICCF|nr:Mitochondrial distribution and morphology protein 31 [Wickerhamomyces ciferrii]CCH40474.1 Mitochondrial distribution and morphology protein 31 [Wickerhamomyces ciferrii]
MFAFRSIRSQGIKFPPIWKRKFSSPLNQAQISRICLNQSLYYKTRNYTTHHKKPIKDSIDTIEPNTKSKELLESNQIRSTPPAISTPKSRKDELLAKTNNFSQRLYIRLKWILKRSMRPFNVDDFSAFFSWLVMGNLILILLGTTTFASLIIYLMNTVFAQELVAQTLGNFITKNTGMTVIFESAIVPGWRDGKISFNKCFVSKRPKNGNKNKFEKGSQADAIAKAASKNEVEDQEPIDDGNYTQFDLTIDQVNISLSVSKFVNGRGILDEVEVNGMRGIVDRTHVHWDPDDDARNYKNIHKPGDFEIDNFKMNDVLFTLAQPNGFRPFNVSIYNCDLPVLRKNWLFYDFLNANNISGAYDDSLFTIHKRQRINDFNNLEKGPDSNDLGWKRVTRCRVDALNVDHLNTGLEGPFGWITSGDVDMIGDIMVPEDQQVNMTEIVSTIADSFAREARRAKILKPKKNEDDHEDDDSNDFSKYFIMDLQIKLNNVKAAVPIFTNDLSYVNNALIRPIVGYINSRKTYIPINCRIVKKLKDFDGSWTVYDSLLMDDMSIEVYDAFANYVANEEVRTLRMKRVGFWTLQVIFQALLMSLGAIA